MIGRLLAFSLLPVDLGARAAAAQRLRGENVVQPQAVVLREGEHAVVPPGVQPAFGMLLAMNVHETPREDLLQGGTAGRPCDWSELEETNGADRSVVRDRRDDPVVIRGFDLAPRPGVRSEQTDDD